MENKNLPTSNSNTVEKIETSYEEMEIDAVEPAGSSHSIQTGHKRIKKVQVQAAVSRLEMMTLRGVSASISLDGSCPGVPIPIPVPVTLDEMEGPFSTPYRILPKEVWVEVFKKCPKDFQTALNTCPDFFGLLGDHRRTKLFPQVLEILFDKANPEWSDEHQLSHKDILQLRGVCSSWNHGVMDYLQNHPGNLELFSIPYDACSAFEFDTGDWTLSAAWVVDGFRNKVSDMISVIKMAEHLLENADHFQKFHKSIFVSRFLAVDDSFMGPMEELVRFPNDGHKAKCQFYVNLTMLLFSFGSCLWYFDFAISGIPENCLWPLVNFWVSQMPNLRTLTIEYTKVLDGDPAAFQEMADEMENFCRRQSPPLESLPHMKILDFKNTSSQIVRGVLRKCGNLEKLRIDNDCALIERLGFAFPSDQVLQKLKELTIIIRNSLDFGQLEISGFGAGSPVKRLFLNCLNNAPEEHENLPMHVPQDVVAMPVLERYWGWQRIFDLLEQRFSSTLTDLKLILPRATREEDKQQILEQCPDFRLRLPNLRILKISIPNWSSIDFLLPMENSLENLEIIVCHDDAVLEENRQSEEIQFNNMMDKMLESNIWNKFPNLGELCVARLKPGQNPIELESYERYTFTSVQVKLAELDKISTALSLNKPNSE